MTIRIHASYVAVAGALALVASVEGFAAQQLSGQDAVEARQHNLKDLGGAFKAVRDQLKKEQPDMTQIQQAAEQIQQLAGDFHTWFPKDSAPSANIETDAKPEIWADPQGFAAALEKLEHEAPQLLTLAKANDLAGVKKQVGAVGGACKGCHDKYRQPDKD